MAKYDYTDEQRAAMKADYVACGTGLDAASEAARAAVVKEWGEKTGGEKSVRGVLSRADVYIAKVTKSKDGTPATRKETVVKSIQALLDLDAGRTDSLVNATKTALQDVEKAVSALVDEIDDMARELAGDS